MLHKTCFAVERQNFEHFFFYFETQTDASENFIPYFLCCAKKWVMVDK